VYGSDLAHVHEDAFARFAERAAPELVRLLGRHGIPSGRIVEFGCGGGCVARRLTHAGYDVRGFDVSPSMIRLARVKAPRARFAVASLADTRIPSCDALLAIGEVVTYVAGGLPALGRFFRRAHEAIRPDGLLIFDFIASVRGRTYPTRTFAGTSWTMAVRADVDRRRRLLTRDIVVVRTVNGRSRSSRETHRVRIYEPRTIVAAVERAGFVVQMPRSYGRAALPRGDLAVVARRI